MKFWGYSTLFSDTAKWDSKCSFPPVLRGCALFEIDEVEGIAPCGDT